MEGLFTIDTPPSDFWTWSFGRRQATQDKRDYLGSERPTDDKTQALAFHCVHEKEAWIPPPGTRLVSVADTDDVHIFVEEPAAP
jgi:hypothetical protein